MNKKIKQNEENNLKKFLDEDNNFINNIENKISKGDENKDIRFNPNSNRKEIDNKTSENQLR